MKTRRERSWREGPHPRDHRSVLVHVRQRGRRRRFPALRREPARSSMSWRRIRARARTMVLMTHQGVADAAPRPTISGARGPGSGLL